MKSEERRKVDGKKQRGRRREGEGDGGKEGERERDVEAPPSTFCAESWLQPRWGAERGREGRRYRGSGFSSVGRAWVHFRFQMEEGIQSAVPRAVGRKEAAPSMIR